MHTLGGKERRGHFPRRRSSPAAFENPEGIASAGSHQTPAGDAGSHPTLRWRGLDSNFQYAGAINLDRAGAGGLIRGTVEITERNRWTQGDLRMASGTAALK